jgi:hypothetical protein
MKDPPPFGRNIRKVLSWRVALKSTEKIKLSLKSGKNHKHLHEDLRKFINTLQISITMVTIGGIP